MLTHLHFFREAYMRCMRYMETKYQKFTPPHSVANLILPCWRILFHALK